MTVLVVGGGFAGIAATWALSRRGRDVVLAWESEGASALYSGALDRTDWGGPPDPRPLSADADVFLSALGCFAPPGGVGARVATAAGLIRPARCRDAALMDLETCRGRRVDVVDFGRPGWDAAALARAYSASAWARSSRTEFRALAVAAPDAEAVRWLSPIDLAARADDPVWATALGTTLRDAGDGESPLLIGPWLGALPGSAERVRESVRRPIGETLSEPGGAAGARFTAARDAWLERAGVEVRHGEVRSIRWLDAGYGVRGLWRGQEVESELGAEVTEVILALGGLVGGGVRFLTGLGVGGRSFSLSIDVPVALRLGGREVALQSGALGADLQQLGLDALTSVGLSVDERQLAHPPDLYAAGDLVADRPRCALEAVYAGIAAARAVCRVRAASVSP